MNATRVARVFAQPRTDLRLCGEPAAEEPRDVLVDQRISCEASGLDAGRMGKYGNTSSGCAISPGWGLVRTSNGLIAADRRPGQAR